MNALPIMLLLCFTGCRMRVASPQFHRAPQITCIVVVETNDKQSKEIAEAAMNACRDALEQKGEVKE